MSTITKNNEVMTAGSCATMKAGVTALAMFTLLIFPTSGISQSPTDGAVTFTRDVAPILQENCQTCHRPGSIGPMSLLTYEESRPWAPMIKQQVATRMMPPWHIDRDVGIQEFKNDMALTDEEIATLVRWVDLGAPLGDMADMPPALEWPDGREWLLADVYGRPPDLVVRTPPYTVTADGMDKWWMPQVEVTEQMLDRPRYIMANETKPSSPHGQQVTHHANSNISNYGVGKPYDVYPHDTGMLLSPGDVVGFNVHYYPIGEEVKDDVVEVGLWFYPEGEEPRLATRGDRSFRTFRTLGGERVQELVLPPHGQQVLQNYHVLNTPARIHSFRGHMHLLGSGMSMEAIYPDGRVEMLSKIGNWQHNWHTTFLYEDHVMPLLPKGTVLVITAWYDNSASNPNNPDADQWVVFGRRTVDEMSHAWVGITYIEDEEYFETLVAERDRAVEIARGYR